MQETVSSVQSKMLSFWIHAIVYLASLILCFYAMQAVNFEKFIRKNHVLQAQLLYAVLVIALAYLVGSFFNSFIYLNI